MPYLVGLQKQNLRKNLQRLLNTLVLNESSRTFKPEKRKKVNLFFFESIGFHGKTEQLIV